MTSVLTPEEYAAYYAAEVGDTPAAPEVGEVAEVAADVPEVGVADDTSVTEDMAQDAADETSEADVFEGTDTPVSAGGIGSIPAILVLALYTFLVWRGATSSSGPVCGRPWLAMLSLSTAAAVAFSLMKNTFSPRQSVSAYDELSKGTSFFPKIFGAAGPAVAGPTLALSMIPFAIFLAMFQYLVTSVIIYFQKPRAGISEILRKSFIAAGISLLMSAIFIIVFLILSNIPAFRFILTIGTRLPFVGTLIANNVHFLLATNPLAILSGITAFGVACSAVNEPPT